MPEQMVKMISTFVEFVPDLDIILNENDECRLVLPWADKEILLARELHSRQNPAEQYFNVFPPTNWIGNYPFL